MPRKLLCVSTLIALSLAVPAHAQLELEEIVVTATKREQTLQEVSRNAMQAGMRPEAVIRQLSGRSVLFVATGEEGIGEPL